MGWRAAVRGWQSHQRDKGPADADAMPMPNTSANAPFIHLSAGRFMSEMHQKAHISFHSVSSRLSHAQALPWACSLSLSQKSHLSILLLLVILQPPSIPTSPAHHLPTSAQHQRSQPCCPRQSPSPSSIDLIVVVGSSQTQVGEALVLPNHGHLPSRIPAHPPRRCARITSAAPR